MNDDLISRQAAIDALDKLCDRICEYSKKQRHTMCGACNLGSAFDVIDELPTADLFEYCDKLWKTAYERGKAEAYPKKGKWLMVEDVDKDGNARYECSLCHAGETHTPKVKVSHCWNCGARMEEAHEQ